MGREKKSRIPTTWKKVVWKIPTSWNTIPNDSTKSPTRKIGIHHHLYFIVSAIVCKHDGRTYLVESDCGICMDDDDSWGKNVHCTLLANEGVV